MKVTEQDVQHVADLANLELKPAERQRYIKDLNSILEYVEVLNELNTDGVGPFSSAAMADGCLLRADEPKPGLAHDSALMNATQTDGMFFQVPKVIEKPGEEKV
jgi:aspartyl-tRNA(Asn)/glutamyl-tRNA(Gln) amidotransferase subunit C